MDKNQFNHMKINIGRLMGDIDFCITKICSMWKPIANLGDYHRGHT